MLIASGGLPVGSAGCHASQKGAERLDELALCLGAYRVEHERRLAAAAHAGEGDEPVLRNVDVGCACARLGFQWESLVAVLKRIGR